MGISFWQIIILFVFIVIPIFFMYHLANKYRRNFWVWLLLSPFISIYISLFILYFLGENTHNTKKDFIKSLKILLILFGVLFSGGFIYMHFII